MMECERLKTESCNLKRTGGGVCKGRRESSLAGRGRHGLLGRRALLHSFRNQNSSLRTPPGGGVMES